MSQHCVICGCPLTILAGEHARAECARCWEEGRPYPPPTRQICEWCLRPMMRKHCWHCPWADGRRRLEVLRSLLPCTIHEARAHWPEAWGHANTTNVWQDLAALGARRNRAGVYRLPAQQEAS